MVITIEKYTIKLSELTQEALAAGISIDEIVDALSEEITKHEEIADDEDDDDSDGVPV